MSKKCQLGRFIVKMVQKRAKKWPKRSILPKNGPKRGQKVAFALDLSQNPDFRQKMSKIPPRRGWRDKKF